MRFDNSRESNNVEDRRGGGGGGLPIGGRGIGVGTIVLALVAMYFGVDPSVVLNQATNSPAPSAVSRPAGPPANDSETKFVRHVLAETEDTWQQIFQQNGKQYAAPTLVLFDEETVDTASKKLSGVFPALDARDQWSGVRRADGDGVLP